MASLKSDDWRMTYSTTCTVYFLVHLTRKSDFVDERDSRLLHANQTRDTWQNDHNPVKEKKWSSFWASLSRQRCGSGARMGSPSWCPPSFTPLLVAMIVEIHFCARFVCSMRTRCGLVERYYLPGTWKTSILSPCAPWYCWWVTVCRARFDETKLFASEQRKVKRRNLEKTGEGKKREKKFRED